MAPPFDVHAARRHFPALDKKQIFFDNAGGTQCLQEVVDSVSDYLTSTNVQLGATYVTAEQSTLLYQAGCTSAAKYVHAGPDEVVLGPSTTQLFRNLSVALFHHLEPGSEIILSKLDHEANVAAWLQMAAFRGLTVKWWDAEDKTNPQLDPAVLKTLLSERTRLVACTHTSNILGTISNIKKIAQTVHAIPGALLCVDAVAYAPHREVDVKELEVDFYSFSWYKVYGPHMAVLYAQKSAHSKLSTLGHFFKGTSTLDELLGLAGASYELVASIPQVCKYLSHISWNAIAAYEEALQKILLDYLRSAPERFQIYGEPTADAAKRVPVISFTVRGWKSKTVVETIEKTTSFGFRFGAFYSNRLVKEVLGLDPADGVVRVSLVHYNTEDEVREFVKALHSLLKTGGST